MEEIYAGGTLVVWAGITEDGQLAINGQDLGGHPFSDEYEYFIRIAPEHWPLLRRALAGGEEDDIVEITVANGTRLVEAGEVTWLKAHGVPHSFHTWLGFD